MALRYWVGGNDTWNSTAGTKWSLTSGGAGGQTVPSLNDDVILDAASGSVTINTGSGTVACRSLVAGTFTGTFQGSGNIQILGSNTGIQNSGKTLEWGPPGVGGMTYSYTGAFTITSSTSPLSGGSGSINFNGQVVTGNISLSAGAANAAVSVWSLINNITVTGASITLASGTFTTNNYNITTTRFDVSNNSLNKVLNFGTSLITITQTIGAAWANQSVGGLTINGTYTIRFTGTVTSSITFIGGGATYYNVELLRGSGTGAVIIQGSNTFNSFTDATGTAAHDINFQIGTTQTFQNFNVRGASTSARVRFTTGPVTLVKIGAGAVTCDYLNLGSNVTTASPDNTWFAGYNSIGTGIGWVLRNPLGLLTMGVGG